MENFLNLNLSNCTDVSMGFSFSNKTHKSLKYSVISQVVGKLYETDKLPSNVISSILVELLSNAIKYSKKNTMIDLKTSLDKDKIIINMSNECTKTQSNILTNYITKVFQNDPNQLYLKRLNELHKKETDSAKIGFLTLILNYNCELDIGVEVVENKYMVKTKVIYRGLE